MKNRCETPTILAKNMKVLITRNWKVLRKKVTRGMTVVLDSKGTSCNDIWTTLVSVTEDHTNLP